MYQACCVLMNHQGKSNTLKYALPSQRIDLLAEVSEDQLNVLLFVPRLGRSNDI